LQPNRSRKRAWWKSNAGKVYGRNNGKGHEIAEQAVGKPDHTNTLPLKTLGGIDYVAGAIPVFRGEIEGRRAWKCQTSVSFWEITAMWSGFGKWPVIFPSTQKKFTTPRLLVETHGGPGVTLTHHKGE